MGRLSEDFKDGYYDGHGQAIANVRYNIINYLKEHKSISIDKVDEICDFCSEIDCEYLNQ